MQLDALIRALAPSEVTGGRQVEIADLAYDTRTLTAGALFFCVVGERVDGHDLAWEAIERGAAAVVVERPLDVDVPQLVVSSVRESMPVAADVFFAEPTKELELAGVTGTNGKTTTAFVLRAILDAAGRRPGLVGTVEWEVGGQRRPAPFTTPEAIDLQRLFREMLEAGDRSVAIEASSHASALHRLDNVRFSALVFTNLSHEHLDFHADTEDYFQAKRRLFVQGSPPAAVNIGDAYGRRLAAELPDALTFGFADGAAVGPGALDGVDLKLRGRFNAENALGAIAAARLLGIEEDATRRGLESVRGVPGRFESIDEG